jgi:hypothetical protein
MRHKLLAFLSKNLFTTLLILVSNFSTAQQTISGTVSDESGPLPGATVLIKGTTNGTQTDFDGNYNLSGVSPGDTLEISYIGYVVSELVYDENTSLQITLVEDTKALDEVVVVGYGTQKKSSLTGSVVKVDNEQLTQVSVANATELLAGRVAGVITKQTTGIPGADGTTLNIRGFGTPLILVDGIEMALGRIDPNDIESINTL